MRALAVVVVLTGSVAADVKQKRPPVKAAALAKVKLEKRVVVAGVAFKFTNRTHGDRAGAPPIGFSHFEIDGAEHVVQSETDVVEDEVVAKGKLFVLRLLPDGETFEIAFVKKAPKPIDPDLCAERIGAAIVKAGLPEQKQSSYTEDGLVAFTSPDARGWCGRYTQRVWVESATTKMPGMTRGKVSSAPPKPKGATAKVEVKKSVILDGIKVEFTGNGHKFGEDEGMWGFTIAGGKPFELRGSGHIQAEVVEKGALFVFRHLSYDEFEVTLVTKQAPTPLDEDKCAELIEAAVKKANPSIGEQSSKSYSDEDGIVAMRTPAYRGWCGRYTQRVWYETF